MSQTLMLLYRCDDPREGVPCDYIRYAWQYTTLTDDQLEQAALSAEGLTVDGSTLLTGDLLVLLGGGPLRALYVGPDRLHAVALREGDRENVLREWGDRAAAVLPNDRKADKTKEKSESC